MCCMVFRNMNRHAPACATPAPPIRQPRLAAFAALPTNTPSTLSEDLSLLSTVL